MRLALRISPVHVLLGLLLVALCAASLLLWHTLENEQQARMREQLGLQANSLARQMETRLADQARDLQRLAERWNHEGRMPRQEWERESELLLRDFPGYLSIQWLDADLRLRWQLPRSEAANPLQLNRQHPDYARAMLARTLGVSQFGDSFELAQGGRGLILYVPLYDRSSSRAARFDGYLQGVFRLEDVMGKLLAELGDRRFGVQLLESGQPIHGQTASAAADGLRQQTALDLLGNSNFSLLLSPTPRLLARLDTPWPGIVLAASLAISVLLVAALYLAADNHTRAVALLASNRQLHEEAARRERIEAELHDSREHQKLILDLTDSSRDGLFIIDPGSREVLYANRAIHAGLGYDPDSFSRLFREAPEQLLPDYTQWLEEVRQLHRKGSPGFLQRELRRRDGSLQPAEISAQLVERHGREFLIGVARDNSERLQLEARLQRLSQQDGLTGLHNRRHFDQQLQAEWRRLRRIGAPLSLLMLDIDLFKAYNDSLGHLAGDDALRKVARLLVDCLQREGDIACRYGGEEFAIILTNTRLKGAEHLAARVHERLAELAIPHPGSPLGRLTLSIGVATSDLNLQEHPQALIAHSDQALYQAKRSGRNRTCIWTAFDIHQDVAPSLPAQ